MQLRKYNICNKSQNLRHLYASVCKCPHRYHLQNGMVSVTSRKVTVEILVHRNNLKITPPPARNKTTTTKSCEASVSIFICHSIIEK
ncbi:hypothetical protein GDO81_001648 [Engystomops pustulosus]|uniref:Uncharacterized protein n=1 Tax=Engystomops pustulosus TaxID=76066 RepID=A0AAV7DGS8_ENGPU|nr:hypothetical protein GDO81_001648 [Engystomops pustulosus]